MSKELQEKCVKQLLVTATITHTHSLTLPLLHPLNARFCMDKATVTAVAAGTHAIQSTYKALFGYEHIDTEFAVNAEGQVKLLQARPVVPMAQVCSD